MIEKLLAIKEEMNSRCTKACGLSPQSARANERAQAVNIAVDKLITLLIEKEVKQ